MARFSNAQVPEAVQSFWAALQAGEFVADADSALAGIRRYFKEIALTWHEWRVEVEQLLASPDGRV